MKVHSDVSISMVSAIIDETIRLIDKSIQCLKDEPENSNALFNLGDSFVVDIKSGKKTINEDATLNVFDTKALNDRLNAADERRRKAIEDNKVFWRHSKPPVTNVFG